jgi:putative spermidine/putrescine transport system permease protein
MAVGPPHAAAHAGSGVRAPHARRARHRDGAGRWVARGFISLVYAFLLLPIVVVVLASFNAGEYLKFPPDGFSIKWYVSFLHSAPLIDSLTLSLRLAAVSACGSTIIGTGAALFYVRYARRAKETLRLFLLSPILLPEILTAIALLLFCYEIGLGTKTALGLQIGHILVTVPFVFLNVSAALYNFDRSVEEAAELLGASRWTTFRRITMPLIKGGVITGAIFAFIVSFDTFSISLLLKGVGLITLPIQLFEYLQWDFDPTAAAVSTISIVITLGGVLLADSVVGLKTLRF